MTHLSTLSLLKKIWAKFTYRRRVQFALLIILISLSALAELVSIGAVFPFLAILTAPEIILNHSFGHFLANVFGSNNPYDLLLPFTLMFVLTVCVSGAFRFGLLVINTRLSYSAGCELSLEIYKKTLFKPYSKHIEDSSSHVINSIVNKANACIHTIIMPCVTLVSSLILLAVVSIPLASLAPFAVVISLGFFCFVYYLIVKYFNVRISNNGLAIARESTFLIKTVQEGLGGIRQIIMNDYSALYLERYRSADLKFRMAQGGNALMGGSPKLIIETLGIVFIASTAFFLSQDAEGFGAAIPLLGTLAMGAQRLLPALQNVYASWVSILGGRAALIDVLEHLRDHDSKQSPRIKCHLESFQHFIKIENVSFRYGCDSRYVLKNLTFEIKKGTRIGIIGATGSGKSTLTDILMGLLEPSEGTLTVDDEIINEQNVNSWHSRIATVPQDIFLTDGSVAENIAFGRDKDAIDFDLVREAAAKAQIRDVVESWPEKYDTPLGERGVFLSGGERQRIGVARAFYNKSEVIILDEATSALDYQTESAVMEEISKIGGNITLVIVAHRISSLKGCDQIVELDKGKIVRVCKFDDL